jgi:hypothetical protein
LSEKLQEGFGEISKLNISLEEKRARGQRLLEKLQVPEADRAVWMDALGGEDEDINDNEVDSSEVSLLPEVKGPYAAPRHSLLHKDGLLNA